MNLHASGVHTSIQTCDQKYTSVDVHVCVFLQEEMQEEDNSPNNNAGTRGVYPPHDCLLFFTYISRYPGVSSHLSLSPSLPLPLRAGACPGSCRGRSDGEGEAWSVCGGGAGRRAGLAAGARLLSV